MHCAEFVQCKAPLSFDEMLMSELCCHQQWARPKERGYLPALIANMEHDETMFATPKIASHALKYNILVGLIRIV